MKHSNQLTIAIEPMVGILRDTKNLRRNIRRNIKNQINTKNLTKKLKRNIINLINTKNLTEKLINNIITSFAFTTVKPSLFVHYESASGDKVYPIQRKKLRSIY